MSLDEQFDAAPFTAAHAHASVARVNLQQRPHILLGVFYELLDVALFDGTRTDCIIRTPYGLNPDITDTVAREYREVKGCMTGATLPLRDKQLAKCQQLKERDPSWQMSFHIYRHSLPGIHAYFEKGHTWRNLFSALGKRTISGISMPLPIVEKLHAMGAPRAHRFERATYYHYTDVQKSTLTHIMFCPELFLEEIGADNYTFEYRKTPEVTLHRYRVRSFPMLFFEEK